MDDGFLNRQKDGNMRQKEKFVKHILVIGH